MNTPWQLSLENIVNDIAHEHEQDNWYNADDEVKEWAEWIDSQMDGLKLKLPITYIVISINQLRITTNISGYP